MVENGHKQESLAELLEAHSGVKGQPNQTTVGHWEKGRHVPNARWMVVLQEVTGIPMGDWWIASDADSGTLPTADAPKPTGSDS